MTCKSELEDPTSIITNAFPDTVYTSTLATPFIFDLYKFVMIEAEIMTFNVNILAFTNDIDMVLQLFKLNDLTGEYDQIGTSFITQSVNVIDYDITPGDYAFCMNSVPAPVEYELLLEFTDFDYIAFPVAIASHGSYSYVAKDDILITDCDNPIEYKLIAGSLPPGISFATNGVIEGLLPELDCVTNNPHALGIDAYVAEFEMEFAMGFHAYIYNYLPGDYVAFDGSNVDINLRTTVHVNQDFHAEYGEYAVCELTNYKENEFYHGSEIDLIFTTYPIDPSNKVNYDITEEIPPSFGLSNNEQGDENEYYPTQVEWEFIVRAFFTEDISKYEDRTFKICLSNNWTFDKDNFEKNQDDFETDVSIDTTLLNAAEIQSLLEASVSLGTDNTSIPTVTDNLENIIENALELNKNQTEPEDISIELCDPCIELELPRIRPIEVAGLCVCETEIDIISIEPEYVNTIPIYCGDDFLNDMFGVFACTPIPPCSISPISPIIIKAAIEEKLKLVPQCDDTCS